MPQSLKAVLRSGISVRVSTNQVVDGFATVTITHAVAKRLHIAGSGPSVAIGRGTVARVNNGTVRLSLRLSRKVTRKLRHLKHVTLTVHMTLIAATGARLTQVVAGRY